MDVINTQYKSPGIYTIPSEFIKYGDNFDVNILQLCAKYHGLAKYDQNNVLNP